MQIYMHICMTSSRLLHLLFGVLRIFGTLPGDLTVSKSIRTRTSNRIEIQFRTFNHLSRPDSFVKPFETLCLCLAQGNEYLGQI
jgi:hypothetical protein